MGEPADAVASAVARPTLEMLVMRVQTKFRTEEDFIAGFRRFCTENTCFVPTTTQRTVGIETGFSIRLADGTPMLRGLCVVLDSWDSDDNPYRRPGVRLGLRTLTRDTTAIFDRLCEARLATGSSPDIAAQAALADELAHPTIEMPPLFPEAHDCTHEDATETMDAPRAHVPTLLGVGPIAVPRTMTPRERVTMPALTATGTQTVIVKPEVSEALPVRRRSWWNRLVWRVRAWYRTRVWARQRR